MPLTSSSICREDIQLLRALNGVSHEEGFYIDVGANDPHMHSVTKLFYDHGWRGINIEPSPFWIKRLRNERPGDVNIQAAASDRTGAVTLFDHPEGGLGTIVERYADEHEKTLAIPKAPVEVETVTLAGICRQHAPATIHFLKVDVEGHEKEVLAGMDFSAFRPWILCIESTEPMTSDKFTHSEWEEILTSAGYEYVRFDSLNRWYVASEHAELKKYFEFSVDDYVIYHDVNAMAASASKVRAYERFRGGTRERPLCLRLQPDGTLADSIPCVPNSMVGFIENDIGGERFLRTIRGVSGHAIYGPYVHLGAGEYRVTFDVRPIGDVGGEEPVGVIDAAAGSTILASRNIRAADLGQANALRIEFELTEISPVEFRVYTSGAASFVASENVALEKRAELRKHGPLFDNLNAAHLLRRLAGR